MLIHLRLSNLECVPYRNPAALTAYYMAVCSCVPILGLPLGAIAILSGISGLVAARANPDVKGVVHAWIGIVLGSVTSLAWLTLLAVAADRFSKYALLLS